MTTNVKTPCPTCPWRRDSHPGSLGGGATTSFIGQAHGPFLLPCHAHYGERTYSEVHADCEVIPQCAGAAVYRANVGIADRMPVQLHRLPADTTTVFASPAEFAAHHHELQVSTAQAILNGIGVENLVIEEMNRSNARFLDVEKMK